MIAYFKWKFIEIDVFGNRTEECVSTQHLPPGQRHRCSGSRYHCVTPRWKLTEMRCPGKVNIFIPVRVLTRSVKSDAYTTGPRISGTRAKRFLPSDIDKLISAFGYPCSSQLRRKLSRAPQSTQLGLGANKTKICFPAAARNRVSFPAPNLVGIDQEERRC